MSQSPKGKWGAAFVATLILITAMDSTRAWSGPRARKGLMNAPPGGFAGTGMAPGFGGALTATGGQQSSSQPGTVSNTGGIPGRFLIAPLPVVPGGTYYVYSQLETKGSLAAFTPPVAGMTLSFVHTQGGISAGALKITYATPNAALFGCSASTTGGVVGVYGNGKWESYPVSWVLNGTSIPSGTFTDVGDAFQYILTAQTGGAPGNPDISAYRAVGNVTSPTSATTTSVTITFDAQPGVVRGFTAWGVNQAGNATVGDNSAYYSYSQGGSYAQFFPVQGVPGATIIHPAQPLPAANTATISLITVTLTGTTTFRSLLISFY